MFKVLMTETSVKNKRNQIELYHTKWLRWSSYQDYVTMKFSSFYVIFSVIFIFLNGHGKAGTPQV